MHERKECKHGVMVSTCRCMSPDKVVTIVPCPSHCKKKEDAHALSDWDFVSGAARHLNGSMMRRLSRCAADTDPNWSGAITIYPPEARELVALIDLIFTAIRNESAR